MVPGARVSVAALSAWADVVRLAWRINVAQVAVTLQGASHNARHCGSTRQPATNDRVIRFRLLGRQDAREELAAAQVAVADAHAAAAAPFEPAAGAAAPPAEEIEAAAVAATAAARAAEQQARTLLHRISNCFRVSGLLLLLNPKSMGRVCL